MVEIMFNKINFMITKIILLSTDPFFYLDDTSISNSVEIRDTGKSFYSLIKTLSLAGLLITGVIAAAIYASTKDARKRGESKEKLLFKFFIIIVVFSFAWIMSTLAEMGNAFK